MLRFAIVGCGTIGSLYSDIINNLGHSVALCIGSQNSRKHIELASQYGAKPSADLSSIRDSNIDGIICALPPSYPLINLLPYSHIPLLVEKPASLCQSAFLPFIQAGTPSFVAYNRLFYDTIAKLKQFVDEQELCHVYARIPEAISPFPDIGKYPYNYIVNSCHVFSILYYLLSPLSFRTYLLGDKSSSSFSSTHFSFGKQSHVTVHVLFNEFSNTSISIKGDYHTALLSPLESLSIAHDVSVSTVRTGKSLVRQYTPVVNHWSSEDLAIKPGFVPLVKSFIGYIKTSYVDPRLFTFSQALDLLKVMQY
jgi:predicted dehydrogenase